jgi:lysophospholipase L1-like esterase
VKKWIFLGLGILAILGIGSFQGLRGIQGGIGPGVLSASKKPDYTFVFVGDSMTEYLGNFDELRADLAKYYPGKNFLLLNYGFGSTNILSVPDRIEKDSSHSGRIFQPINKIPYDAIFIESMGNNPLSQFPVDQGLEKQNQALDQIIADLMQTHPHSPIIFVATIAPNKEHYGEGVVVLQPDQRSSWVVERNTYIQNHIKYASDHRIPLVDIYDKSVDQNGDGNLDYLNSNDFIHPSPTGIYFISQQIADFTKANNLVR